MQTAVLGDRLVGVGEVTVVVVEAKRQALEDRRRQLRWIEAQLHPGIAAEKGFVEFGSDHAERLLFEMAGLGIGAILEATNARA